MRSLTTGTIALLIAIGAVAFTAHTPAVAQEEDRPSDAAITAAVADELLVDPGVKGFAIDVSANEGVVTLSGRANNLLARERATLLAQAIRGVRSVVNVIEVAVPDIDDAALRQDIRDALRYDRATEGYEIDVKVDGQIVTLNGSVESWQEKVLAGRVAKGVRGVMDVRNVIEVEYQYERPDSEIEADIKGTLRWHTLVDDAMIEVRVEDGDVYLSGIVGSASEKHMAQSLARVYGTMGVDASELEVERWTRSDDLRKGKYVDRSDEAIRESVKDALMYDPRVLSFEIDVGVDDGVVTLNGAVDNLAASRAATRTARHTVGVWRVKNRIRVRPNPPEDAEIKETLEEAYQRTSYIDRYDIRIEVRNGEAVLSGTVDTYFEKRVADNIASSTYGVASVNNNIAVSDDYGYLPADPYVDDYRSDSYAWNLPRPGGTYKPDWEIEEDVEDELWWDAHINSFGIDVDSRNGVVRLTGEVDTLEEYHVATQQAYEGGAVAVDNDLEVQYGPKVDPADTPTD